MFQKSRIPTAGVAIFSNPSSLPMRHTIGYLVTMLFHIVSDFPGNDVKCSWNIW